MINDTKCIILDVPGMDRLDSGEMDRLKEKFPRDGGFGEVVLLSPARLNFDFMSCYLAWYGKVFTDPSTLVVFPGNGASIVRRYVPKGWLHAWNWIGVDAKRIWIPGEDPQTVVGRIADRMMLGIKTIIIMDDVISSGATIRRIKELNEPWIPGAVWDAWAWVRQKSANTKGFSRVNSTEWVGTFQRKTPINSLTTLLENPEIARSYAERNFSNPAAFLAALEELR